MSDKKLSNSEEYWREAFAECLCSIGIFDKVNSEQLDGAGRDLAIWHDNYGMAFGHDCIPNPIEQERDKLSKASQVEKEKIHCKECNGTGSITNLGPYHSATSQCWQCRGEGRYTRK